MFLVVLATLVATGARRWRIPAPSLLVVASLAVALPPGAPAIRVTPEIIGLVVLPPLLYASAEEMPWRELRAVWKPVSVLAVGLVLASAAAVGYVASVLTPLSWQMALVLGSVLASTDPVAVASSAVSWSGASGEFALLQRKGGRDRTDWRVPAVLSWAGTRGVMPLAAALFIPVAAADGTPLAQRPLVLVLTSSVVVVTLVVQGFTLAPVVRRSGIALEPDHTEREDSGARLSLAEAGLRRLDELSGLEAAPEAVLDLEEARLSDL
ncbi:cation:proton antiporter [Streptomyces goshikiensis]|uniref:cation:proton antiporter domain-containing protein n=1 Tax=Streptomyces goshikiensis TaxID=1942 RepID=UPI0036CAFEFA